MDINVFFAVIFAAFLHATWNGMAKSHKDKYVAVAAIVVWGFTKAPIPLVSALRETSVIIALLIGTFFLKERFTIIKAGAILIIFTGIIFLKFF